MNRRIRNRVISITQRPLTEPLESRRLMSSSGGVTLTLTNDPVPPVTGGIVPGTVQITHTGTLVIHGTAGADVISVDKVSNGFKLIINKSISMVDGEKLAKVKRIRIEGGGGDDSLTDNTDLRSTLMGESGDDVLVGGRGDLLVGGKGNDKLVAGTNGTSFTLQSASAGFTVDLAPAAELHGGAGRDRLYGFEDDTMDGGGGNDQAVLSETIFGPTLPPLPADPAGDAQTKFGDHAIGIESFAQEQRFVKLTPNGDGTASITVQAYHPSETSGGG